MNNEFHGIGSALLRAFDARPPANDDGEHADALGVFRGLLAAVAIVAAFWIGIIVIAVRFWA